MEGLILMGLVLAVLGGFGMIISALGRLGRLEQRLAEDEERRERQAERDFKRQQRLIDRINELDQGLQALQQWLAETLPEQGAGGEADPGQPPPPTTTGHATQPDGDAPALAAAATATPFRSDGLPASTSALQPPDGTASPPVPVPGAGIRRCPACFQEVPVDAPVCLCGEALPPPVVADGRQPVGTAELPADRRAADQPATATAGAVPPIDETEPAGEVPVAPRPTPPPHSRRIRACPNCGWRIERLADGCQTCGWQPATAADEEADFAREHRAVSRPAARRAEPPAPSWFDEWRASLAGEEWEAIIGASLLNKIGGLILVIGIALFMNYSYGQLGAAGKAAMGMLFGGLLIAGGVVAERRSRFLVFARGLVGTGWAAIYYTCYAIHGVEAARLIESPAVGMGVLVAAAAGMIAHALSTGSEPVTALAYFIGFVTLLIGPRQDYSLLASVPLVASLLLVGARYRWDRIMVGGLVLTYGSYMLMLGDVVWRTPMPDPVVSSKLVLALWWLMYELYDLYAVARRRDQGSLARTLFPMNACAFVVVGLMHKPSGDPHALPHFLGGVGLAYLVSMGLRAWLRPPASFEPGADSTARATGGGYEGAVSIAMMLLVPAIILRLEGYREILALLFCAEMLFLSGVRCEQPFLRRLGLAVFEIAAVMGLKTLFEGEKRVFYGHPIWRFSPQALLIAVAGYFNRAWFRRAEGEVTDWQFGVAYSVTATVMLTILIGIEAAAPVLALCWLGLAMVLMELGTLMGRKEFRGQGYAVGALALLALLINGLNAEHTAPWHEAWIGLGATAVLTVIFALRHHRRWLPADIDDHERGMLRDAASIFATIATVILLWRVLPVPLVAIGWGVVHLALLELGCHSGIRALRTQAHLVGLLVFGRVFLANLQANESSAGLSHRLLTIAPLAVMYGYGWSRLSEPAVVGELAADEWQWQRAYLYPPVILAAVLLRFELGVAAVAVGWAALTAATVGLGRYTRLPDLRWQGYLLAVLAFGRCVSTNFGAGEAMPDLTETSTRVLTGVLVLVGLFAAMFLLPRRADETAGAGTGGATGSTAPDGTEAEGALTGSDFMARSGLCALAVILLSLLVYYEVSRDWLTMAWGIEGGALLAAGFALRERSLRYAGIVVLLGCIGKLMLIDLWKMDRAYQILSFCLVGPLLMGVSWVYANYREELKKWF